MNVESNTQSQARAWPDIFAEETDRSAIGAPSYTLAADAIRRDIIDGRFADGERLMTNDLADRYKLSLAPIREALLALSAEGIVILQPKRGAVVRTITPAFIEEIYEIRLGLIPYLEGERAVIASDEDVSRMRQIQADFEDAAARGTRDAVIQRNIEFHGVALNIRPNREALQILRRHHTLIRALRARFGYGPSRMDDMIDEHHRIIDAFARHSREAAQEVSRQHLGNAYRELIERISGTSR